MAASALLITVVAAVLAAAFWVDRAASRREAAAEATYPPTGRMLDVGGIKVHAHVAGLAAGTGPDLILIHGASGNTRDFTFDLVARLSDRYRVIVFDRPGLGHTESLGDAGTSLVTQADLLRAAADQLGVTRPIIVGQSYGGAVALAWALSDPGGPGALVLLAAASEPWPGGLGPWYPVASSKIGAATVIPLIAAFAPLGRAAQVIDFIFAPQRPPPGYAEAIGVGLTLRRKTIRMNARQVHALKRGLTALAPRYPSLTLPVEMLHGTADTIVPLAIHSGPLSRQIPGANLVSLPGIGHMLHHADPGAVVGAIDRAAQRAGLHRADQSP